MSTYQNNLSRREFLLKTGLLTASLIGTGPLLKKAAGAIPGEDDKGQPAAPIIALIIDDVGYNYSRILPFLDLGAPLTFSVLPRLLYSQKSAEKVHAEGHEVMLHQPMEPHNRMVDPGPGALYLSQSPKERYKIIEENISGMPFAIGANNHMGSLFTESREQVNETLNVLMERELFFVDSITTRHSVAYNTAKTLHMPSTFRDIFIDPSRNENQIKTQLKKLKKIALSYGQAVGIGHPRPETARALKKFLKDIKGSGISLIYISKIIYS
jgi:hypothetical protein